MEGAYGFVKTSIEEERVVLLIGGSSGQEPLFLEFIGDGFADAVCQGIIFAAPSPDGILAVTKEVDRGPGVLYVYGNYAGDVLNFDMAAELAEFDGIKTATVRVTDDVASAPSHQRDQRRGIAGDLFVIKIAGAACAKGWALEDVVEITKKARDQVRTMGVALAPGIVWALSEDGFRRCVEVARDLDTFITIHTIETLEDNQYSQDKYGLSTLEFFEKAVILSAPFLAVHCAEITPEEIGLLARHDVRVSYNAISNMMMGYKTLPLRELLDAGITVGLATDGAASNDNQNMLQVLKISPLWQKAFYQDPAVIPASRVLEMATIEGARAVFRDHEIGSLEPGKMADFFVYNPAHANSAPMVDPVVNLVYSADSCNVETTVVGGEIVYGDGKIIRVREKDLVGQIQENALRLWEQAGLFNEQWNRRVVAEPFRQPR